LNHVCITDDSVASAKGLLSLAAILVVLFNLPVLIGIVVEEVVYLVMSNRPELRIDAVILEFEAPLRIVDYLINNLLSDVQLLYRLSDLTHNAASACSNIIWLIKVCQPLNLDIELLIEFRLSSQLLQ